MNIIYQIKWWWSRGRVLAHGACRPEFDSRHWFFRLGRPTSSPHLSLSFISSCTACKYNSFLFPSFHLLLLLNSDRGCTKQWSFCLCSLSYLPLSSLSSLPIGTLLPVWNCCTACSVEEKSIISRHFGRTKTQTQGTWFRTTNSTSVLEEWHFLTHSELIEPVSTQAAQLTINFLLYFFHNTQLEMHLLFRDLIKDTPVVRESWTR